MPYLNGVCEREPYEVIVFILADGERYPDGVRWSSYPFRPTISFNFDLRGLRSVAKNASYRSCVQIVEFHGNWGLQFKNGASDFKLGKDYIGACTKSESYK